MTRIVRATRERSRWWLGVPLLAAVVVTLVLVQGAFSQPSTHSKAARGASSARAASTPPPYTCGETVSGSITLNANLPNCGGNGLNVGANGTTINLNGFTISGTDTDGLAGVKNPSFTSVTVKNGTLSHFGSGVEFDAGATGSIQGLRTFDNVSFGISVDGAVTVTGNTSFGNGYGIVTSCCDATFKATITNNVVTGNNFDGIIVDRTAPGSIVTGNRSVSNQGKGIWVLAPEATVTNNVANGSVNGSGMVLTSNDPNTPLKASGNKAYFNTKLGINFGPGDIDLGKNIAGGNGSAHQCENIVCSSAVTGAPFLFQAALTQPTASRKPLDTAGKLTTVTTCNPAQQVSGSVTLTVDLTNCPGNGMNVSANGTTINLNGHTISGTGMGNGVLNNGFTGVTVKNGTISSFNRGVSFVAPGSGTVQGLRVHDNTARGISINGSVAVTGNTLWSDEFGIFAACCGTYKATITNNISNSNGQDGIHVESDPTSSVVVSGNRVLSNGNSGIFSNAPGVTLSGNTANANGFGMHVFSPNPASPIKASVNRAYWNDQLGLAINPADIDLGKNLAGGNGSAHQCENVVCSP